MNSHDNLCAGSTESKVMQNHATQREGEGFGVMKHAYLDRLVYISYIPNPTL